MQGLVYALPRLKPAVMARLEPQASHPGLIRELPKLAYCKSGWSMIGRSPLFVERGAASVFRD